MYILQQAHAKGLVLAELHVHLDHRVYSVDEKWIRQDRASGKLKSMKKTACNSFALMN